MFELIYYGKKNKEKRNHLSCEKLPQHYSKTKHVSFMIIGLVLYNLYFGENVKRLNTRGKKKEIYGSIILPQGPSNGMYQSQLSLLLIEPSHVQLQNRQPWLPAKINNINLALLPGPRKWNYKIFNMVLHILHPQLYIRVAQKKKLKISICHIWKLPQTNKDQVNPIFDQMALCPAPWDLQY